MSEIEIKRILLIVVVAVCVVSCRERSAEEIAAKIEASDVLSHIDQTCMKFPKPGGFKQIKKGISGNSEVAMIYYQYVSEKSFLEVRDFYRDPLTRGSYELTSENYREPESFISELRLLHGDVRIVVEHRPPSNIFSIGCIK